jgi:hypothetical protein
MKFVRVWPQIRHIRYTQRMADSPEWSRFLSRAIPNSHLVTSIVERPGNS